MALEGITRHPNLWFEDGNVILIAEDTGFCVYRGVLVGQSNVFRDRLRIPQSSAVDACPVVHMGDDNAKEVAIVLDILYNSGHSFYRNAIQATFETAAAALRLGSKYGFDDMKHEALRRISTCYTTDLANLHTHADDCDDPSKCPISWEAGDCIGVLHLARQLGLGMLVPAALYRCANDVSVEQIFKTSAGHDQLPVLGRRELEDCVRSRDDLMLESIQLYGMVSNLQPSLGCLQVAKKGPLRAKKDVDCLQILKAMIASAQDSEGRNFCGPLTLFPVETYVTGHAEQSPSGLFCAPCGKHFKSLHAQQREEIWSRFCEKYGNSYHSSETDSTRNSEATAVNPKFLRPLSMTSKVQRLPVDQFAYSSTPSYIAYLTRFVRGLASPLFDLLLSVFFKPFLQRKAYMGVIRM